jgi:hypothetical protein
MESKNGTSQPMGMSADGHEQIAGVILARYGDQSLEFVRQQIMASADAEQRSTWESIQAILGR